MVTGIIRNIWHAFLSLWLISLLIFLLSRAVPGDPVRNQLNLNFDAPFEMDYEREYAQKARETGLDKPMFYFALMPIHFPGDLHSIMPGDKRQRVRKLLFKGFDYWRIMDLLALCEEFGRQLLVVSPEKSAVVNEMFSSTELEVINRLVSSTMEAHSEVPGIRETGVALIGLIAEMKANPLRIWIPKIKWYGMDNQYHHWIKGLIKGDPGLSYTDGKSVGYKIKRAMVWTVFLVFLSLTFSYILGILLGIFLAGSGPSRWTKWIERALFAVYAVPIFWLATVLLVFFTTEEYGAWTKIFPSVGLAPIDMGQSWTVRLSAYGSQLVLPAFCLIIHNLAFLGSLVKRNTAYYMESPFVITAKAYGFGKWEILAKEVFPHTLLPLITSFTSALPAAIGGSLVIEIIFNIPGMGRLMYNSILNYDWPVVFAVVMLIALITIISFFAGELLYRWADPRIYKSRDR